jgi:hypothetical protein
MKALETRREQHTDYYIKYDSRITELRDVAHWREAHIVVRNSKTCPWRSCGESPEGAFPQRLQTLEISLDNHIGPAQDSGFLLTPLPRGPYRRQSG